MSEEHTLVLKKGEWQKLEITCTALQPIGPELHPWTLKGHCLHVSQALVPVAPG